MFSYKPKRKILPPNRARFWIANKYGFWMEFPVLDKAVLEALMNLPIPSPRSDGGRSLKQVNTPE